MNMNKEMKEHLLVAGIVVCVTLILILFCVYLADFLPKAQALEESTEVTSTRQKCFTSYQIQYGDTLSSIAKEHMSPEYGSVKEYIKEVQKINGFVGDTIYAGAYLVLPYYK